ncbi:MAG: YeeE/YedE thiosulfate transporter family protein, partial [Anderseniella sp.]
LVGGRLRYRGFATEGSLVRYITGGVLMGFGGVTALGCSVGQALTGVSSASISSVIAVLGIAAGGYSAMLWQARVENSSLGSRLFPAE